MSEHGLVRCEAKARHLEYLVEQLNTVEAPGGSGKPVDEMARAYREQMIAGLCRGLAENERQAKVRH